MTQLDVRPVADKTAPLGSIEYAEIAARLARTSDQLPAGWRDAGAGSYRRAFIGPDGLVYKTTRYGLDDEDYDMQVFEVTAFHLNAHEPWVPPSWLWSVPDPSEKGRTAYVTVMPFLSDDGSTLTTEGQAMVRYSRFDEPGEPGAARRVFQDLDFGNRVNVNGLPVVVDGGALTTDATREVTNVLRALKAAGFPDRSVTSD